MRGHYINGVIVLFLQVGFVEATKDQYPDLEALLKASSWRIKDRNGDFAVSKRELAGSGGMIQHTTKAVIDDLLKDNGQLTGIFLKNQLTVWVDGSEWRFINWTKGAVPPSPSKFYVKAAHTLVLQCATTHSKVDAKQKVLDGSHCALM